MNCALAITDQPVLFPLAVLARRWLQAILRYCAGLTADSLTPDADDETLMTAYLDGDQRAFRWLFDRFAPRLFGAALRRGLSRTDAQDAVQQTFVHVHQSRKEFKSGAAVRPWLYTIGFNVMRDYGRRLSSQKRLRERLAIESETRAQPSETNVAAENHTELQAALDHLSAAQREVLVLHYFEEMNFSEIARLLGSREGAIRVRAHRGYEKLRRILSSREHAEGVS